MLVFGQTLRHEFVNYDDQYYVYDNPLVARGLTIQGVAWACTATGQQLASAHLALAHAGLPTLRADRRRAPRHERLVARRYGRAAVAAVLANDGRPLAQRIGGGRFRHPSLSRGISGLGRERKDVLSGLFFVLTLAAYVGYASRPFSLPRYLAVVVLFALGLMAKPMLVTLPFVLAAAGLLAAGAVAGTLRVPATGAGTLRVSSVDPEPKPRG